MPLVERTPKGQGLATCLKPAETTRPIKAS